MIILGLLLGLVDADTNTGLLRYTFGLPQLADGIGFVVVAMGLFGFSEIIVNLERRADREVVMAKINSLMPTREDFAASWKDVALAWQPRRVFYPPAEPGVAAGCPGIAHCGRASRGEKEARRSFSGVIDD